MICAMYDTFDDNVWVYRSRKGKQKKIKKNTYCNVGVIPATE